MTAPPTVDADDFPPAELDRRFYALAIDRLIAWSIYAAVGYLAVARLIGPGSLWAGLAVILATVLLVAVMFTLVLGLTGSSPGKAALGVRVVGVDSGRPIGVGPAGLRTLLLGFGALPTFGFGVAMLAWTAAMDDGARRRGWHDQLSGAIVVDVRPPQEVVVAPVERPRQIVNLTAMRLVPAPSVPLSARPASPPTVPAAAVSGASAGGPVTQVPAVPVPGPLVTSVPPTPSGPPATTPSAAVPTAGGPSAPAPHVAHPVPAEPASRRRLGPPLVDAPLVAAPPAMPAPVPEANPLHGEERTRPATRDETPKKTPTTRPTARWRVSFDTGETFVVDGLALVGRRPEARSGETPRHLVSLRSQDMSVSKTHAQFQVVPDGALVVMDRGSTNGSILLRSGISRELRAGKPATLREGDRVRFGDREMRVAREG